MMDRASKSARRKKAFLWLIFLMLLFLVSRFAFAGTSDVLSPLPDASPTKAPKQSFSLFKRTKNPDDLNDKINSVLGDAWNDYSIIVEDYTSDFRMDSNGGQIFVAASVNKVPILAVLYTLASKGQIDLDRDITLQEADIQDYGTGSIRYDKPGTVYSVKTLAKLMIKKSDNTAAYILANHIIGFDKLTATVSGWNLLQTDMVTNKTSNQDIAKLFRLIYEGNVTDQAHTEEMLTFLRDTDFETRLPAGLPKTARAYHKIGTEVGIIHDAGIVADGERAYYIGIFTNGTAEGAETDALIAKVSKTVYDFMR